MDLTENEELFYKMLQLVIGEMRAGRYLKSQDFVGQWAIWVDINGERPCQSITVQCHPNSAKRLAYIARLFGPINEKSVFGEGYFHLKPTPLP